MQASWLDGFEHLRRFPQVTFPPPLRVLYKFRKFPSLKGLSPEFRKAAENERHHALAAICDGRVRLARPASFSDPFDCHIQPVPRSTDPEEQERVIAAWQKRLISQKDIKLRLERLMSPKKFSMSTDHLLELANRQIRRLREEEIVMYCFAGNRCRPAMWSHYADGHKGLCIHFDAAKPPFKFSYTVIYQDEVAEMLLPINKESNAEYDYAIQQSLLIKSVDWAHEEERRFVVPHVSTERFNRELRGHATINGLDCAFSPERVIGVSIGEYMDPETQQELLDELDARGFRSPIYKARISKSRFVVEFDELRRL